MSEIQTNTIYLVFEGDETGERGIMPATELVECGTPIDDNGDDMAYVGWTTDYSAAINYRDDWEAKTELN